MPIYEYQCSEGHHFEELRKIADDPLEACVECGSPVKKLVSRTAFSLKGGGWYQDGYTSKASKPSSGSDSTSTPSSSEPSPAKPSETKTKKTTTKGEKT